MDLEKASDRVPRKVICWALMASVSSDVNTGAKQLSEQFMAVVNILR